MKQNSKRKVNIKPELLAPAGNITTFYAVINAGADAVYMAGNRFGARAYADNFSGEEIISCIRYAHLFNRKVYLTVNTLIREDELSDVIAFLRPLYESGLDGVIVQDYGVLNAIRYCFPKLLLHASTQMTITGFRGANFLKENEVCRVVPARELSLEEIKEIKEKTGLELECFIHGAMCYSYSGQCLFSSIVGKRSGNRGRCAGPCRLPYSCRALSGDSKEIYPISLKDMCTIDILPSLIDAGIDSFKIEGRMKKPEYAAGVTAIYRKAIDQYYQENKISITKDERYTLENLYIRSERSAGYYKKYNGADMITLSSPSYNGTDESVLKSINEKYISENARLKHPVMFYASFIEGQKAQLTAISGDLSVCCEGELVQEANGRPVSANDIIKGLSKVGQSNFYIDGTISIDNITISDNPYYSLKGINELRRNVLNELENEILRSHSFDLSRIDSRDYTIYRDNINCKIEKKSNINNGATAREYSISIATITQFRTIINYIDEKIEASNHFSLYIEEALFLLYQSEIINYLNNTSIDVYILLPQIRRIKDYHFTDELTNLIENKLIKGLIIGNYEDLAYAKKIKEDHNINVFADYSLYSWNNSSICSFDQYIDKFSAPIELSKKHQLDLFSNSSIKFEKMIYGNIALMKSANCLNKTFGKCKRGCEDKINVGYIKDRTNREFSFISNCLYCQNTLYNSVPLTLFKGLNDYPSNVSFRLSFTTEKKDTIIKVLDFYNNYFNGVDQSPEWDYTNGFEKKSAE